MQRLPSSKLSPRRVTVVASELRGLEPTGGMGTATTFLSLALAQLGHSVEILSAHRSLSSLDPYWDAVYRRAGIRIRPAPEADEPVEPWPFVRPHTIELGLRADPPDVVIAPDFAAPAYSALRLRQAGVAFERTLFAVFCHGSRRYTLDLLRDVAPRDLRHVLAVGVLEQAAVELADVVVSPSAYLVGWMREQGWRLPEDTRVIPYFTRSDVLGDTALPAASGDGGPVERLTFFGRVDERKGLRLFAEGLNALDPELLRGVELEFLGKTTGSWPRDRVEALLLAGTKRALRRISFEASLDQHEALVRLSRPGTLAVMPSLQDNSPNAVYECLELGIPFVASNVGGIPELVAPEDRERVLFEPTPSGVAAAIGSALVEGRVPKPPRRAFDPSESFARWSEVVALQPKPQPTSPGDDVDVVLVRRNKSRTAGLQSGTAPYVIFLDEEDILEPEALSTLVRAQRASGADVVTCGLRVVSDGGDSSLHFFFGEPRGLGVLANDYGNVALYRRAVLDDLATSWPVEQDEDWPLLARLSLAGARIVSVPAPLVTRHIRPGSIERDPSDALLVVHEMERALPERLRSTVRLVAGLAAAAAASAPPSPAPSARRMYRRLFRGAR